MSILEAQMEMAEREFQGVKEAEEGNSHAVYEEELEKAQLQNDGTRIKEYQNKMERLEQRSKQRKQAENERMERQMENQQKRVEDKLEIAMEQLKDSRRDYENGVFKSDYWVRKREEEARGASQQLKEISFGSRALNSANETMEKYEKLEKQKEQQEELVKIREKEFRRTVNASGTPQGNDYWVSKRERELESSIKELEKTNKKLTDL